MPLAPHEPGSAASFPRRLLAALIDGLVLAVGVQAVHWSAVGLLGQSLAPSSAAQWHLFLLATVSLPCWLYYALGDASARQATFGKRWLGLRVVDVYGARIGLVRSLVRNAVKLVPWEIAHVALCFPEPVFVTHHIGMPRLLVVSYAVMGVYLSALLMTLKKQSVHDLVAGTYVARVKPG
jgi:uncharacterized RDD family membrane protein YckC